MGNGQKHCVNLEALETGDCQAAIAESPYMQTSKIISCLKKIRILKKPEV